jgi:hypothetical protein
MEEIKLKDLIYIKRNFLTPTECDSLIKQFDEIKDPSYYEACPHAVTGLLVESTYEAKQLAPKTEPFNLIHSKTNQMINEWTAYLDSLGAFHVHQFKQVVLFSHKLRLLKYNTGGWIHPHIDWDHFTHGSCTFALNDDYEGGDFSFWNGNYKVKLNRGDAMIFPADCFWVHAVEPITSGVRYSTNSFITSMQESDRMNINKWWMNNVHTTQQNDFRYTIE